MELDNVAQEANDFVMWTIYLRPLDFPDKAVARKWLVRSGVPEPIWTDQILVNDDIEVLRGTFRRLGLYCQPRRDGDEPQIVEVWF